MGRKALGAVCVVLLIAVFGTGWLAARRFQSPAQREREARPPAARPILAPVTSGVLDVATSGSGHVGYASVSTVSPTVLPANAVVTRRTVRSGGQVAAGTAITELNGRPVFVFAGRFAFYRDLARGDRGPDVTQLQRGLRAAGLSVPAGEHGRFGAGTQAALADLYRRAGYVPATGLPLDEVAVAAALPGRLVRAPAVGTHPDTGKPLASVGSGRLTARVAVGSSSFVSLTRGLAAGLTIHGVSDGVPATVVGLSGGATGDTGSVTLAPTRPLPASTQGRSVVAVITIKAVAARSLLVPTRALARQADGSYRVLVRIGTAAQGGSERAVPVRVLGNLNGQSAIAPAASSDLGVGTLVVVG